MTLYETKKETERVILVGVSTNEAEDVHHSLEELGDLADTAGAEVVGVVIQRREMIHPATYIGKGKIDEVRELIFETAADAVICDDELSPAQMKNLAEQLDARVLDRTLLILDIFAGRAATSEGKIQVELAQLKYRQTHLIGMGANMSRLGGGIGTRGPGEKKLEIDRRLIRDRIAYLNRELKEVRKHRELTREQRSKGGLPVIAIVGYTNAGKSTLLNHLTGAGILAEDKLFATLDPTTRCLKLPGGQEVLLTDTVGFINKLPHNLVEAFRSTLEEARYADVILHVADCSNPMMDEQMYVVYETLRELGATEQPVITAFNKADRLVNEPILKDLHAERVVLISAKTGENIPALLSTIEDLLRDQKILIERIYPYSEGATVQLIRRYGEILSESYEEDGIHLKAYVSKQIYGRC